MSTFPFSGLLLTSLCLLLKVALLGQPCTTTVVPPVLSATARASMLEKLAAAKADYEQTPQRADALIWYGRRMAYLGQYAEAIALYTEGIATHPNDARLYRHRGHRYLTLRCFELARADFERAYALTRGQPDEVEPDGQPNAQGIPTSTLQSNIRYHLGLCWYLAGQYRKAARYFDEDLRQAANDDTYVASANWLYLCRRRLHQQQAARKLLRSITPDLQVIENFDYLRILQLHQDSTTLADFAAAIGPPDALSNATLALGLANYYALNDQPAAAELWYQRIVQGNQWASFAYIAAEIALAGRKNP